MVTQGPLTPRLSVLKNNYSLEKKKLCSKSYELESYLLFKLIYIFLLKFSITHNHVYICVEKCLDA